ncbi:hypothetical protein ACOMHN_011193 [Nucella lapillus]
MAPRDWGKDPPPTHTHTHTAPSTLTGSRWLLPVPVATPGGHSSGCSRSGISCPPTSPNRVRSATSASAQPRRGARSGGDKPGPKEPAARREMS